MAHRSAIDLGHDYIGLDALFLSIIRLNHGASGNLIRNHGITETELIDFIRPEEPLPKAASIEPLPERATCLSLEQWLAIQPARLTETEFHKLAHAVKTCLQTRASETGHAPVDRPQETPASPASAWQHHRPFLRVPAAAVPPVSEFACPTAAQVAPEPRRSLRADGSMSHPSPEPDLFQKTPQAPDFRDEDWLNSLLVFLRYCQRPTGCAACDRGDFQLGHHHDCPKASSH